MITRLATILLEKPSSHAHLSNPEVMQHLRTEYLVRFLFFFLLAVVISTAFVLAFHHSEHKTERVSSVDFSMMREAASRYKREFLFFGVFLLCIILLVMIFQATMFVLLQTDLWQELPTEEYTGKFKQITDTMVGRIVTMNQSIYIDRERLLDTRLLGEGPFYIRYLRNSHLILTVEPIH